MDQQRLATFEVMWREHPTSLVFVRVADEYLTLGETQKALDVCLQGIEHHPSYASGYFLLGECHMVGQQYEEATEAFERVLHLDTDHLAACYYLAELYEASGHIPVALDYLERIILRDPLDSFAAAEIERLTRGREGDLAEVDRVEVVNQPIGAQEGIAVVDDEVTVSCVEGDAIGQPPEHQRVSDLYGEQEDIAVLASLASDVLGHQTASLPEKGETPERKKKRTSRKGKKGDASVTKLFEEIETDATVPAGEALSEPVAPTQEEVATLTLAEVYAAQGLLDR
ncbi:MAG: tetratricopeptide repeat protein, partial [Candidatus Latescibacteria bacterium]|nr:tetratricopeptide repeat protein [Candidatus Latescibacterota bacterium]